MAAALCVMARSHQPGWQPKTTVLLLAGGQGEYGMSIYQVVITNMSMKFDYLSCFTQ